MRTVANFLMPEEMKRKLKQAVENGPYQSEAEFMRTAIREYMEKHSR